MNPSFYFSAALTALFSAAAYAAPAHCSNEQTVETVVHTYLPPGYTQADNRAVRADGVGLRLIRYQPAGTPLQYGGTHFSILGNAGDCVVGFIRLTTVSASGEPPRRDEAHSVAEGFLRRHAPDLLADHSLHSISEQSQTLHVNGQTLKLRGTMVKMRNRADGSWFWVVIDSDRQVMLFERDLRWSNLRFARTTERWLYDEWRAHHNDLIKE